MAPVSNPGHSPVKAFKKRLSATITPWKTSPDKPPFSVAQLIAMALLSQEEPMVVDSICEWVVENFKYYRAEVVKFWTTICAARDALPYDDPDLSDEDIQEARYLGSEIVSVLRIFDLPFAVESDDDDDWLVSASNWDCRTLLLDVLDKSSRSSTNTVCRFFDLPVELRISIYEMVFAYPRSGLRVLHNRGRLLPRFAVLTDGWNADFGFEEWDKHHGEYDTGDEYNGFRTRELPDILAPLRVCRQMYNEAKSIFYELNHFHCDDLNILRIFLTHGPKPEYVKSISATYEPSSCVRKTKESIRRNKIMAMEAIDAFTSLVAASPLKMLHIRIEEHKWLINRKPSSAPRMPGVAILRKVRADKVDFHGSCPYIEAVVKGDILMSKAKPKSTIWGVKRRSEDEESGKVQTNRKVKRARKA